MNLMQGDISFDSVNEAVTNSIHQYGKKSEAIMQLIQELRQHNIQVNDAFQIFPDKERKAQAFEIITNYYEQNQLDDNEKSCVLYALVQLNIQRDKICKIILHEIFYNNCISEMFIWELCDMLYELKQKQYKKSYIAIAQRITFGSGRQMIFLLMGKLRDDCYIPTILNSLNDNTVNGHALLALSAYKDKKYDIYFKKFLKDKRRWVRGIAEKRLRIF